MVEAAGGAADGLAAEAAEAKKAEKEAREALKAQLAGGGPAPAVDGTVSEEVVALGVSSAEVQAGAPVAELKDSPDAATEPAEPVVEGVGADDETSGMDEAKAEQLPE